MSLIGRRPVSQNSGVTARSTAPQNPTAARALPIGRHPAKQSGRGDDRERPAECGPDRQRQRIGTDVRQSGRDHVNDRERDAADGHEDRISRRMRLMQRGIEVVQSECEVDRVDVFEGGRQERQVREQPHGCDHDDVRSDGVASAFRRTIDRSG